MNQLTAIISLALGLTNLIGFIYVFGWKIGRLELKTETMWKYIFEAAFIEARQRGVVAIHNDYRLSDNIRDVFVSNGLGEKIQDFYVTHKLNLRKDSEITWELFNKFQEELIEQICMPLGLNMGAALIGALQLCKETDIIEERKNAGSTHSDARL